MCMKCRRGFQAITRAKIVSNDFGYLCEALLAENIVGDRVDRLPVAGDEELPVGGHDYCISTLSRSNRKVRQLFVKFRK